MFGEVTELQVVNIDQHPYHHHVQPYQIVAMDNDTDAMNAWWRVSHSAGRTWNPGLMIGNYTARYYAPTLQQCIHLEFCRPQYYRFWPLLG